jgi:hypothetical protein
MPVNGPADQWVDSVRDAGVATFSIANLGAGPLHFCGGDSGTDAELSELLEQLDDDSGDG